MEMLRVDAWDEKKCVHAEYSGVAEPPNPMK